MLGRSPSASTPSKCSTISSEPVHVFNTLSSLPHKISSSNSASSPPLARSFSQSVTKFTPNEQHSQKPKLRDGLQTWTSNVFKKLRHSLRALIRSHDNYKEEDYIYDIEIERTVRDGSVTVAKALFDSGCGCEGILISESLAESAGIPDPKFPNILEPTEYGFLNGLGCHGYSHDMCQMRWSAKQYEERKNQAIFLSPAFMKSKVTIIPNLQVDVVIGLPEIKRLGLDRKKKFLFGLFPKMATPDTSQETREQHDRDQATLADIHDQRVKEKNTTIQQPCTGSAHAGAASENVAQETREKRADGINSGTTQNRRGR